MWEAEMRAAKMVGPVRPVLGKGLMVMGTIIFVGEILYALSQVALPWQLSADMGWMAAVGVGVLRIASGMAWKYFSSGFVSTNPEILVTMLTAGLKVLVLCWPLALVVAGADLAREAARDRN
jgi:hypothetical protein